MATLLENLFFCRIWCRVLFLWLSLGSHSGAVLRLLTLGVHTGRDVGFKMMGWNLRRAAHDSFLYWKICYLPKLVPHSFFVIVGRISWCKLLREKTWSWQSPYVVSIGQPRKSKHWFFCCFTHNWTAVCQNPLLVLQWLLGRYFPVAD